MGRPLNSKYFGDPSEDGNQFTITFGASATAGWIVKQLGSKRFRCTDGTTIEDCTLVTTVPDVEGEMAMTLLEVGDPAFDGAVIKITGRRATVDNAGVETVVSWNDSNIEAPPVVVTTAKAEPKKPVVEKVVKDIVQDKPVEPKVEEPKKAYKPRAKKAPVKKTFTKAKTTRATSTKTDSEE